MVSECVGIWAAIGAWFVLIPTVEITTVGANTQAAGIQKYFQTLFFLGSVPEMQLNYTGVSQDFFVQNLTETPIGWFSSGSNDSLTCTLVLPATSIGLTSVNMPWLIVAWILPVCTFAFVLYLFVTMIRSGVWSFEEMAYIEFSFDTYASRNYKIGSLSMALGPLALAILWGSQVVIYQGDGEWEAFKKSIPSMFVLILAVKTICLPWVRGHHWNTNGATEEFLKLRLRRPIKMLNPTDTSGHNSVFSLNFAHALWLAKHAMDQGRPLASTPLRDYVTLGEDGDYTDEVALENECRNVLRICDQKVTQETQETQALGVTA